MIVEIYSYESGIRCIDKKEYSSDDAWEKDLFLLKLSGTHVGYRLYDNINMAQFDALSETQRNNLKNIAVFDREAYVEHGHGMKGKLQAQRNIQAIQEIDK
jgi:hypothetical protein